MSTPNNSGGDMYSARSGLSPLMPIRVFISAPVDVRLGGVTSDATDVLTYRNHAPRYEDPLPFLYYQYEEHLPQRLGLEPQRSADLYMLRPEMADIVIGLFWKRIGTPTEGLNDPETNAPYVSGNVYELLSAYRHLKKQLAHGDGG